MQVVQRQLRKVSRRTSAIRIAIVDPRRLIAHALSAVVGADAEFDVVCVATGSIEPVEIIAPAPDLVLVGVSSEPRTALALIEAIAPALPLAQIVIIADALSPELVRTVLERALGGLLLTDHAAEDLVASLTLIAEGRAVLPTGWQTMLATGRTSTLDALSDRQLEVLRLLADGCSYEEIGSRLFISVNTVKFHTRSIFERLGVRNRMAAARVLAEDSAR